MRMKVPKATDAPWAKRRLPALKTLELAQISDWLLKNLDLRRLARQCQLRSGVDARTARPDQLACAVVPKAAWTNNAASSPALNTVL